METTMELDELDELVANLDTQVSATVVADDAATPSLLLCSFDCGGGHGSWYHCW